MSFLGNRFGRKMSRRSPRKTRRTRNLGTRSRSTYLRRRLLLEPLECRHLLAAIVVNAADDVDDGVADAAHTSLREAIIAANADETTDTIHFNIGGGGAQTIMLDAQLPSITDTVIIDGSTQPADINGASLITIDASAVTHWVVIAVQGGAAGSELRSFRISNVGDAVTAISLGGDAEKNGNNIVENLDISGGAGFWVYGSNGNTISETTVSVAHTAIVLYAANENIVESCDLSTPAGSGVRLIGASYNNLIQHNNASGSLRGVYLGDDVTGTGNRIIGNDFSNTGSGIIASYGEYGDDVANHIEDLLVVKDNVFTNTGTAVNFVGLHDIDLVASPDFDIDVREARYGLILQNASNVTIDGFDLSGDGTRTAEFDRGLGLWGTNTNITVRNIISQNRHTGIQAQGLINSEISNADLSWTTPPTDGRVSYGLSMSVGSENNTVHDVTFENQFVGIYLSVTDNVTMYCNRIVNNEYGVSAQSTATNLTLYNNQIEGNTTYGIWNKSASLMNAENNYWGAANGPTNLGGSGDSYREDYSDNVDADPFLTSLPPCLVLNVPPVADDLMVNTDEDVPVDIVLTASDDDGDSLTYSVLDGPDHGTLSGELPNLQYTPDANFFGSDSFTFQANDSQADSNVATVSIIVNSVIDALIDVKPGNGAEVDPINLGSNGKTPIAILATQTAAGEPDDFDPTLVDLSLITFKINGVSLTPSKMTLKDVDGDGDLDLLLHFLTQDLADILTADDVDLALTAEFGGDALGHDLGGSDAIKIVPPKDKGKGKK